MREHATSQQHRSTHLRWIGPLIIVVVGVGLFSNTLSGPFIFDDRPAILDNPSIRALSPLLDVLWPPRDLPVSGRPIVNLSLAINYGLGGFNVRGYHAFNLFVHVLNGLLLFSLLRWVFRTDRLRPLFGADSDWLALAAALLWLVHPLQTECVNYVTQRTESMMAAFYLLTLNAAARAHGSSRRRVWSAVAVGSCTLGALCKESIITAPLIVCLLDRAFLFDNWAATLRSRWRLYVGFLATGVVVLLIVLSQPRGESVGVTIAIGPWMYLKNQCVFILQYIALLFWPHPLTIDYGYPKILALPQVAFQAIALLILLSGSIIAYARRPAVGFVGIWFFVTLAPTSSVLPIITEVAAERRMYLPSMGLIAAIVVAVYLFVMRRSRTSTVSPVAAWCRPTLVAAGLLAAVPLAIATWARNGQYATAESIWHSAVEARPDSFRAQSTYGAHLAEAGLTEQAIAHYRKALKLNSEDYDANMNLCAALGRIGRPNEAIGYCERALQTKPGDPAAHQNLGLMFYATGRYDQAVAHFRRAQQLPGKPEAMFLLARALMRTGAMNESVELLEHAVRLKPDFVDAGLALGSARLRTGQPQQAIRAFDRVLQYQPSNARALVGSAEALTSVARYDDAIKRARQASLARPKWLEPVRMVAWLFATHPNPASRQPEEALRLASRVADLENPPTARTLDTLAAAYAAAGQFDSAVATAEHAVSIAESTRYPQYVTEIRSRLSLYRAGESFTLPSNPLADVEGRP